MTKLLNLFSRRVVQNSYHNDMKYHITINPLLIVAILVKLTKINYNIQLNFGGKKTTIRFFRGIKMLLLQYPTFVNVSVRNKITSEPLHHI